MPECTFTSKRFILLAALLGFSLMGSAKTYAQTDGTQFQPGIPLAPPTNGEPSPSVPSGKSEPSGGMFDQSSPYLQYGEFNTNEDEDNDTQYFQYGRFFGLSLGLGYQTATGNRGLLYQAAFPRFDIRVHYWFDFNFAMDLGIFIANHSFEYGGSTTSVKLTGYGADLKYYFDTRNASAAISFASPFLFVGAGAISKSQIKPSNIQADTDSTISVSVGGGLEFPISYKKTYFVIEGRYFTQNFADTTETAYANRVPDLSGGFFSLSGQFMFVW